MLLNVLPFGARDFAVDLGTANTVVYAPGRGIVVDEPSIVAINTRSDKTEAVGHAAHAMLGRTPANITTIRPLRDGVIADFEAAERLLSHLIRKAQGSVTWRRTRLVIGIPSGITQVERRAVVDSAYRAKASEVHLVDEPMAAAIGAGLPVTEATGSMVVDIGGGTTDIAVISLGGMVYTRAIRTAGHHMDEAIMAFMRRRHGLLIGERTSRSTIIASLVALAGVVVMLLGSALDGSWGGSLTGKVLAILMTLCMAIFSVIMRGHRDLPMLPAMALSAWLCSLFCLSWATPLQISQHDLLFCAAFGTCQNAAGLIFYTFGTKRIPAAEATLLAALEVPFTPFWVWLFMNETPATMTLVGGGIVLVALFSHILGEFRRGGKSTAAEFTPTP